MALKKVLLQSEKHDAMSNAHQSPFKGLNEAEFHQSFDSEEKCFEFLAKMKWGDDTFSCKKCGNNNYCDGKTPYSRRCTRCKHDESAQSGSMFHGCKIPLTKAFYIAFTVCNAHALSSHELSKKLELRQMTCWKLKKRLTECLSQRTDLSEETKSQLIDALDAH